MVTLYHGSDQVINRPDVAFSRDNLDFGRGFYATSFKDQAERPDGSFDMIVGGVADDKVYRAIDMHYRG